MITSGSSTARTQNLRAFFFSGSADLRIGAFAVAFVAPDFTSGSFCSRCCILRVPHVSSGQSGRNVGPFPQLSRRLIMSKRTNFHRFKNQTSFSMNPDFTKKHPQNDHNSFRMNNFLVIVLGNPCSIITLQKQPPGYLMRFRQLRSGDKLFYMSSLRRLNSAGTTC